MAAEFVKLAVTGAPQLRGGAGAEAEAGTFAIASAPQRATSPTSKRHMVPNVRRVPRMSITEAAHYADRGDWAQVLDQHPVNGQSAVA